MPTIGFETTPIITVERMAYILSKAPKVRPGIVKPRRAVRGGDGQLISNNEQGISNIEVFGNWKKGFLRKKAG